AGSAIDRAGIGIGRGCSAKDENSEWRAVVADYISLYTPETLAGPVPGREDQAAQLAVDEGGQVLVGGNGVFRVHCRPP
ncbi:hypothetical protein ACCS64_39850, partial [Rhizobium ruizarguesonis]